MINSRLMNVLRGPVVSEKSNLAGEMNNCIVLKVLPDANKFEIKAAVEKMFNVKVASVRTLNMQGKKRRSAHGIGVRSDWKKAYVTLAAGESIDALVEQVAEKETN